MLRSLKTTPSRVLHARQFQIRLSRAALCLPLEDSNNENRWGTARG
jgi:hypothetical protein